jgi:amphi-Trp domain-containing protein
MAETTTDETAISWTEAATFLRTIADELDGGAGVVGVAVGDKEIRLSRPERFDAETTITERSRRLRKDTEAVSITFRWNQTGDWRAAIGIGVVAWVLAVPVLFGLSSIGIVSPEALGVPGA